MVETMNYQVFNAHAQGENHKKSPEKECQDFSLSYVDTSKTRAIAIVADGHGSDNCFRSATGSKIASEQAFHSIFRFIGTIEGDRGGGIFSKKTPPPPQEKWEKTLLPGLVKNIVAAWHTEVEKDHKAKPFSTEEIACVAEKYQERYRKGEQLYRAYGTTLIAAAAASDYWFGIHIGDGKCTACYPDGSWEQPIPWDDKCFLNVTTSICDDDAIERVRVYYRNCTEKEMPVMVFINTDGVDDSYPAGDNEKHLAGLYRTIALNFIDEIKANPKDGFENGKKQAKEFLPDLSRRGSGDDVSIAALIDVDALKMLEPILRQQLGTEQGTKSGITPPQTYNPAPQ
ncbi:hypothetical protein FACS189485_06520 [Spirochaetia bacterium]|nr:hypothetical protein FACS189485_06520 [Spirochaetia bacterium]